MKFCFSSFFIFLLIMSTIFSSNVFATNIHSLDRIAAIVNDEIITENQLAQSFLAYKKQLEVNGQAVPDEKTIKAKILNQLIDQKLQLQLAKRNNINATKNEIEQAIQRIATQNHLSTSALIAKVKQMGMDETNYRQQIQNQITLSKVEEKAVSASITIADADVAEAKKFYEASANNHTQYHLFDLLIPLTDSPTAAEINQANEKAKKLLTQISHMSDWSQIENSSDLGWRFVNDIPNIFVDKVLKMQIGEISDPIRAPNGLHLIKLVAKNGQAKPLTHEELQNLAFEQKFGKAVAKWLEGIRKGAYIKIE